MGRDGYSGNGFEASGRSARARTEPLRPPARTTDSPVNALHKAIFVWRLALGIAWGGLVLLGGLHALTLQARSAEDLQLQAWLGVTAIAAGNFVFMAIVADRVVQVQRRGLLDALEFGTAGLMVIGAFATGFLWLGVL